MVGVLLVACLRLAERQTDPNELMQSLVSVYKCRVLVVYDSLPLMFTAISVTKLPPLQRACVAYVKLPLPGF